MLHFKHKINFLRKRDILPLFLVLSVWFAKTVSAQQVRDLYVISLTEVLNDRLAYDALLNNITRYNINSLTINDFSKNDRHPDINQFFADARLRGVRYFSSGFPVEYFTNVKYSDKAFDGYIRNYTYEREWWNDSSADPLKELKRLEMLKRRNGVSMKIYFGWFGNKASADEIAQVSVRNFEQILLHHYRDKPDYNYLKDRLLTFAKAAKRLNKRQDVIIRFSAEKQYMNGIGPAMVQDFYSALEKAFEEDKRMNPDLKSIRLIGYQIYQDKLLESKAEN